MTRVLLTIDGPYAGHMLALPITAAYKTPITNYLVSSWIGSILTTTDLDNLAAAGWSMQNHTVNWVGFTTMNQADAQAEIAGCRDAITALGFSPGLHFACPSGVNTATIDAALAAEGMLSARNSTPSQITLSSNLYRILGTCLDSNSATITTAKALYDSAVAAGKDICYYAHDFAVTNPTGSQMLLADLDALIAYILGEGGIFMTVPEYVTLAINSRPSTNFGTFVPSISTIGGATRYYPDVALTTRLESDPTTREHIYYQRASGSNSVIVPGPPD